MADGHDSPTYELTDGVAVITLDDGKANAIAPALLDALHAALDRAESDGARAVMIAGREGKFCAGFDLAEMTASVEQMRSLVAAGGRFLARLYGLGVPTVAACTGHSLAAGALILLACDHRIGVDAPAKIGLNEAAIGMPLPIFAVEMARDRLAPTHLTAATVTGHLYDPESAVEAGYLDRVVPVGAVADAALADASRLAEIRSGAVAGTKQNLRGATIARILDTLDDDIGTLTGPVS